MSLNKHIFANYIGVAVTTALTFLVVPFYLKWLGADAYGLIGIATMLQAWIMLLNAGLAPVAGRQAAQAHGGSADWNQTGRFFRTIDNLLLCVAIPFIVIIFFLRHWLAENWLEKSSLATVTIEHSIVLLVAMTLIRLMSSVSRGVVANLEEQIWLNINLVIFNVLRFAVSLPIVYCWPDVNILFTWWLLVSLLEYFSIQRKISLTVPVAIPWFIFDITQLKLHGKMALTLAVTSGIWIVVTNLDKLLLSVTLSLANYGYFSIAALLASGVLILSQPISQAFQPRLTKAYANGGMDLLCREFQLCTRWLVILVFPVGAVIFALPETILYLWTHDKIAATNAASILQGYVLGSTLLAAGSLMYAVQVAIGNVQWHLRGHLIFAALLSPVLPWIVLHYGAVGAAWLWAGFNVVLFLGWNTFVLKKLVQPLFPRWIWSDTLLPLAISFSIAMIARAVFIHKIETMMLMWILVIFLTVFIFGVLWFFVGNKKNDT